MLLFFMCIIVCSVGYRAINFCLKTLSFVTMHALPSRAICPGRRVWWTANQSFVLSSGFSPDNTFARQLCVKVTVLTQPPCSRTALYDRHLGNVSKPEIQTIQYFFVPCRKFGSGQRQDTAAARAALPIPMSVCGIFVCKQSCSCQWLDF